MTGLVVASYLAVIGFSTAPFALSGDATTAALIAGIFALANTLLNGLILRQAKRNANLTGAVADRVDAARQVAREGVEQLVDVKAKVRGERRKGTDRRPPNRKGGRRAGD